MAKPELQRHGDTFIIVWHDVGMAFGIERIREVNWQGLVGELTVEARPPYSSKGRVVGPINLALQSSEDQERKATMLSKRVNGLTQEQWQHA